MKGKRGELATHYPEPGCVIMGQDGTRWMWMQFWPNNDGGPVRSRGFATRELCEQDARKTVRNITRFAVVTGSNERNYRAVI